MIFLMSPFYSRDSITSHMNINFYLEDTPSPFDKRVYFSVPEFVALLNPGKYRANSSAFSVPIEFLWGEPQRRYFPTQRMSYYTIPKRHRINRALRQI